MNLVRHKVAKLHHVDVTNHDFLVERIASTAIEQTRLAVLLHPREALLLSCFMQIIAFLFFFYSTERGSAPFKPMCLGRTAEMGFKNLTHIHTTRDAYGVEHIVAGCSARKDWHVSPRHGARHDPFIAVGARH